MFFEPSGEVQVVIREGLLVPKPEDYVEIRRIVEFGKNKIEIVAQDVNSKYRFSINLSPRPHAPATFDPLSICDNGDQFIV